MYQPVPDKPDFPALERRVLEFWEETRAFDTLRQKLATSDKRFSFIDGPITANNPMAVHHAWGRTYKDLYQRCKAMTGHDVMPWCPRCGTGISHMEIETEGYSEVTHTSLYVRFPLVGRPNESLLVWTTTPWTLTSNVAAAVHPDLTYARAVKDGQSVYL